MININELLSNSKIFPHIKALMEIVDKEDLSVLISSHEDGKCGLIFDHRRQPTGTILRNFNNTHWEVYYETESAATVKDIHKFNNLQDACRMVLSYAQASKNQQDKSNGDTKCHLLYWTLDESGVLTLSGKGPMAQVKVSEYRIIDKEQLAFELEYGDWMLSEGDVDSRVTLPWNGKKVRKVIIEPGLTTVSFSAFSLFSLSFNGCFFVCKYENLKEIILPNTIETLEWNSISDCPALEKVVIPDSVTGIWENEFDHVFNNCPRIKIYTPAGSYAEKFSKKHKIAVV